MPKTPKKSKEINTGKGSILMYFSGTNHATCIPKIYKSKVPKKDNPDDRYTVKTGCIKDNNFWFDSSTIFADGSKLEYWPM
jgi:hypothetical protein